MGKAWVWWLFLGATAAGPGVHGQITPVDQLDAACRPLLSAVEAENALKGAAGVSSVRIGYAGTVSRETCAMAALLRDPGGHAAFRRLVIHGSTAGQLYGLLGLRLYSVEEFESAAAAFEHSQQQIHTMYGCIGDRNSARATLQDMQSGTWSEEVCAVAGVPPPALSPARPQPTRLRKEKPQHLKCGDYISVSWYYSLLNAQHPDEADTGKDDPYGRILLMEDGDLDVAWGDLCNSGGELIYDPVAGRIRDDGRSGVKLVRHSASEFSIVRPDKTSTRMRHVGDLYGYFAKLYINGSWATRDGVPYRFKDGEVRIAGKPHAYELRRDMDEGDDEGACLLHIDAAAWAFRREGDRLLLFKDSKKVDPKHPDLVLTRVRD